MDKELLKWTLTEMDESRLQDICKTKKIKIPGFRSYKKYPKSLIISKLLKNKNDLINHLKELSDVSEEKKEFNGKSIMEMESLIDIKKKEKTIEQIIYLITQNKLEYMKLAKKIINKINTKDNVEDKIIIDEYEENKKKNNNMVKNKMNTDKYIVNIKVQNDYFYNIYPLVKIEDNELTEVQKENYPDYGNINVNPYLEFSKQNYDIISPLWICKFNEDQLEDNLNKTKSNGNSSVTKFKINGDELIKDKSIYSINEEGIYEIVELLDDSSDMDKLIYNDKISIKSKPILEKVYIKDNDNIYGPFGYRDNNRGGGYYLDKEKNDYIVKRFSIEENKLNLSVIEIYNQYDYNNSYIEAVYFYNKENLISESIDTIDNEKLVNKFKKIINTKNTNYSMKEIQEIRNNIKSIIDNSLSEERRNRLKILIKNTEITDEFIGNDLIDIIGLLLKNEEKRNIIANKILEKPENLRKLQNVEKVDMEIFNKNKELDNIKEKLKNEEQKLEEIQLEIKDCNNKNIEKLIEDNETELKAIKDKKEEIEKEIEKLIKKYNLCHEIEELVKEKEKNKKDAQKAKSNYDMFLLENQKIKEKGEMIQKDIKKKLENVTNQYANVSFDGMIANEMLESAAKWSKEKTIETFENVVASKENVEKNIEVKSFKDDDIIDYIYNKIKQNRNYSRNEIINIMICLTQGFLTVFAGEPGVGKTSLCNIIANVLGLSNENSDYNRFIEISVEKGWTSKRDLIGYYNPLTKSFDKNNSSLFKTFNILNQEYKRGINDFPYYILLDEANLSPMEYYWADFMNACDLEQKSRKINLGEDYIYNIPQTLRFLATINYDHTTETLSPRLIDRSWIILLEPSNLGIDDCDLSLNFKQNKQVSDGIIMFQDLERCFSYSSYDSSNEESISTVYEVLKNIYVMFKKNNISISPRINNMIKMYLKVGCNLFEDTEATREFVALDYAVAQKLLPKINGYGDEYKDFLEKLYEKFDSKNMMKCKNTVESIIEKGKNNMQYYQFFA